MNMRGIWVVEGGVQFGRGRDPTISVGMVIFASSVWEGHAWVSTGLLYRVQRARMVIEFLEQLP